MLREYIESMGEISGFGGEYEKMCQRMVLTGLDWFDSHPLADPKFHSFKHIYGIIEEDNEDAKELSKVITDVADGCTGAMHQVTVSHVMWIKGHSWDEYVEIMKKRTTEEKE